MGITKSIAAPSGASSAYWEISSASSNPIAQTTAFDLAGYVSKDLKDSGSRALDMRTYTLSGADYLSANSDPARVLSALLSWVVSTQAEFSGGVVA